MRKILRFFLVRDAYSVADMFSLAATIALFTRWGVGVAWSIGLTFASFYALSYLSGAIKARCDDVKKGPEL